ncbi:MAG: hypothetical protein ACKVZJ_12000 [Phycisphaerales bacterium]
MCSALHGQPELMSARGRTAISGTAAPVTSIARGIAHALILAVLALAGPLVSAQSTPPAPAPAEPKPAPAGDPSLDDLLGLPKAAPKQPNPAPDAIPAPTPGEADPDPQKAALERKLTDAEAQEAFKEAVRQMGEVAARLEKSKDTGLTTQRIQEDILRKLDALIKHQQQQPKGGSSSSSSNSDDNKQSQNQPSQPQKGGQKGQQNQKGGSGDQAATPPPGQDPQLKDRLEQARAAWGALPERLREAFTQGMDDYYSRLYQSMTEEYYRKTAESAGK